MKTITPLFLALIILSCGPQKAIIKEREAWGFKDWKDGFKSRAFCLCLLEGYDNKEVRKFILENDKSYYDGIAVAIFDPTLDPIIRNEVIQMKKDSAESVGTLHLEGKRIFNHCLRFYESKRLDSIARAEIPKWKKIENIGDTVGKYMPAY